MKYLITLLLLAALSSTAQADARASVFIGGTPIRHTYTSPIGNSSDKYAIGGALALRTPAITGIGLELAVVNGSISNSILWDIVRSERFILYANTGMAYARYITAKEAERSMDVLFGVGSEVKITGKWFATASARMYLPEPGFLLRRGEVARPTYKEAMTGVLLCAGLSWQL